MIFEQDKVMIIILLHAHGCCYSTHNLIESKYHIVSIMFSVVIVNKTKLCASVKIQNSKCFQNFVHQEYDS